MRSQRPSPDRASLVGWGLALWLLLVPPPAGAQRVILHLRNGDRVAGTILSEDTNQVVISTVWIEKLAVPLAEIARRESLSPDADVTKETQPGVATAINTHAPAAPAATTNGVAGGAASSTNAAVSAPAAGVAPALSAPAPEPKAAGKKDWKLDARVGTDLLFGARDRQLYHGKLKFTYARPYKEAPSEYFRTIVDYNVEYGKTEGVLSDNRMSGSVKTDFDIGKRVYLYNSGGAGYDEVRKIDLFYEVGPGVGYHLITTTNFILNVEAGGHYQVQERSDSTRRENFYVRLAEDFTWKISPRATLTEKFEFLPQARDFKEYLLRFEATLSYALIQNVSLNLSVIDLYDTRPARDVTHNELQIRSSLGVTF